MKPFEMYQNSFVAAAHEIAQAQYDESSQYEICRKHGIFLESLNDDEFSHLESLVQEFAGGTR